MNNVIDQLQRRPLGNSLCGSCIALSTALMQSFSDKPPITKLFTGESIVAFFILMLKMFNLFVYPVVFYLPREYFNRHLTKNVSFILFITIALFLRITRG